MKTRFLFLIFLVSALMCGAQTPWNGTVAEAYDGGDGTPENPYQIATAEQLALLAQQTNNGDTGEAHFILTNDINLNGTGGQEWTPIGTAKTTWLNQITYTVEPSNPFMGVFDGNNHSITEMYIDDADILGLFGCTLDATVRNLRVENANVTQGASVGIIVGLAYNTDITDCEVSGEVQAYGSKVGGIAGHYIAQDIDNDTVFIRNCVNNAYITAGVFYLGGIAGFTEMDNGNLVIDHCVNNGEIGDMWNTGTAGGIVGQGSFILRHCHNFGKISGETSAGGMVGEGGYFGLIEFCSNHPTGEITGGSNAGGIIGTPIYTTIRMSGNMASVTGQGTTMILVGGIAGSDGSISNCFNTGNLSGELTDADYPIAQFGGITGSPTMGYVYNVYNTGQITKPSNPYLTNGIYGHIIPAILSDTAIRNCYYFGNLDIPAYIYNTASSSYVYLPESCAFNQGATSTSWVLDEPQYGTTDLLEALNAGAMGECVWVEDTEGINGGFPIPRPKTYDVVAENDVENPFNVYPNPANDMLFVDMQGEYRIINMMGQTVMTGGSNDALQQIIVSGLSNGLYFISIDGFTMKFIVKH